MLMNRGSMNRGFQVEVICSDPRCDAELTLWVDELGEVEAIACECGHGVVAVRIEGFEPVFAAV
jgi:TusA-related sulfurtransferase